MPEKPRGERTCFAAFVCNARNLGMGQTRPPGFASGPLWRPGGSTLHATSGDSTEHGGPAN